MKAKIKVKNIPDAPKPTKAVRMGNPNHTVPSMLDIPNKRKLTEEVCIYRSDLEGIAFYANKFNYSRAMRTISTAFHLYFHPEAFENIGAYEKDMDFYLTASLFDICQKLIVDNYIRCHIERCLNDDGEYLPGFSEETVKDVVWYDEKRFSHIREDTE